MDRINWFIYGNWLVYGGADVQKIWPASVASRNELSGADERINAATAPAVTSTTARRDHKDHKEHKPAHRRNGAIFKVHQPSPGRPSRDPAPVQATDYKHRAAPAVPSASSVPPASSAVSGKKRYHKKHLRELDHFATAVHLVADTRNSTSNIENQGIQNRFLSHLSSNLSLDRSSFDWFGGDNVKAVRFTWSHLRWSDLNWAVVILTKLSFVASHFIHFFLKSHQLSSDAIIE